MCWNRTWTSTKRRNRELSNGNFGISSALTSDGGVYPLMQCLGQNLNQTLLVTFLSVADTMQNYWGCTDGSLSYSWQSAALLRNYLYYINLFDGDEWRVTQIQWSLFVLADFCNIGSFSARNEVLFCVSFVRRSSRCKSIRITTRSVHVIAHRRSSSTNSQCGTDDGAY